MSNLIIVIIFDSINGQSSVYKSLLFTLKNVSIN